MSRHRRQILGLNSASSSADSNGNGNGHAQRPWVYFMIDCFFLITEFFIVCFKFKNVELNLVNKLPAGGPGYPPVVRPANEILHIHLIQKDGQVTYLVQTTPITLPELDATLVRASAKRPAVSVRISYEGDVAWKEVVTVMNACTREHIENVGLQPLRSTEARP